LDGLWFAHCAPSAHPVRISPCPVDDDKSSKHFTGSGRNRQAPDQTGYRILWTMLIIADGFRRPRGRETPSAGHRQPHASRATDPDGGLPLRARNKQRHAIRHGTGPALPAATGAATALRPGWLTRRLTNSHSIFDGSSMP